MWKPAWLKQLVVHPAKGLRVCWFDSQVQQTSFIEINSEIFLWPFSSHHLFKKGSCQLLVKKCALSTGELLS